MSLCPFNHFFAELELVKLNWVWVKISFKICCENTLMCNADIQESIGVESRRKMEFTYFSLCEKIEGPQPG